MPAKIDKEFYDSLTEKECVGCKLILPIVNFGRRNERANRPYRSLCRQCESNRVIEYKRRKDNARSLILKKYEMTEIEYDDMLQKQDQKCKICNQHETVIDPRTKMLKPLCVDHCHSTNKVRGLLCSKCNTGIGMVKDNIEILKAMKDYLNSNTPARY